MPYRINILIAAAALTVMTFYLLGRYLIVAPVARIWPDWAGYAAGAAILVGLMLTVQVLAKVMDRFRKLAVSAATRPMGTLGISAQGSITAGHLAAVYGIYGMLSDTGTSLSFLLSAFLYAAGLFFALNDWRRRAGN
jgi:hypothetical protein